MSVAQDISVSPLATNDSIAGRMLVAVEQRAQLVQMVAAGEGRIEELNKQIKWKDEEIAHLEEIIRLQDEKIQLYVDKEKVYQEKDKTNQLMSDMKDKACIEQVKAAKPTFGQNMTKYLTGFGAGGVFIGILLLIL